MEPQWINVLLAPPYMISSPAAPFLINYYHDGVGMSACGNMREIHGKRRPGDGEMDGNVVFMYILLLSEYQKYIVLVIRFVL